MSLFSIDIILKFRPPNEISRTFVIIVIDIPDLAYYLFSHSREHWSSEAVGKNEVRGGGGTLYINKSYSADTLSSAVR